MLEVCVAPILIIMISIMFYTKNEQVILYFVSITPSLMCDDLGSADFLVLLNVKSYGRGYISADQPQS